MHPLHPTGLLKLSFGSKWAQKTKTSIYEISRILFQNMDFNFALFARFNFAHFQVEGIFGLIWAKLQNGWCYLQISISGIWKVLLSSMGFIFAHFVYKGRFGQIWVKITQWSIRLENFYFGVRFTNYGVPFCLFWIQKRLLGYFVKIYCI